MRSNSGPVVIEVNASPGLEGIETTTRVNVAKSIITHVENKNKTCMIEINGIGIRPGENKSIKIKVGKLHSGTTINIYGQVFNSAAKGKRVLLVGGIHGDEINGTEIIRRAIEKNSLKT